MFGISSINRNSFKKLLILDVRVLYIQTVVGNGISEPSTKDSRYLKDGSPPLKVVRLVTQGSFINIDEPDWKGTKTNHGY